jgi:hypothetical protein
VKARILSRLHFVLLFIASLTVSGRAEVWQSQEFNFGISLPENGWTHLKPANDVIQLAIRSSDRSKMMQVSVFPTGNRTPESFLDGFRKKFFEKGTAKVRVEERININGHPACRLKDIWIADGKELHKAVTLVINDGVLYTIDATGLAADPMSDPAVKECVASFHFLNESPAAQSASKQAVIKKTAPLLAPAIAAADAARSRRIVEGIADFTLLILVGIVIAYIVTRILRDVGAKTKSPPPFLFPTGSKRTTPPPLPQPIANRTTPVSSPQKLDAN